MKYSARVFLTLKKSVHDPQGDAVKSALTKIGFDGIASARIGKLVDIQLEAASEEACKQKVEQMCKRLLVNAELETYEIQVVGETGR